jgi:pimeloyl-ACP methyl ester carboxylesterase
MADSARERMLAGLPVAERRLRLAGVSTSLLEAGNGAPLVLLHGGIESGGAYWAPVVEQLAESHRLVIPDVPGLGESEPFAHWDMDAFVDWFRALLESTCDDRPALIAHSLGGALSARYAARDGGSLRRLVIYAAPAIGPYRIPLGLAIRAIMFDLRPSQRNADRFDRFAFFDFDAARRRDHDGWLEAWSSYARERATVPHVKRTMRQLIKTCTKEIPDAELRRIEVPTALVWGSHDRFVRLAHAERASERLGWPLRVIDEAGHVPHIERTEAFLDALPADFATERREEVKR